MSKIRVFADETTLEIFSVGSRLATNGLDIIEEFEVNGKRLNLTVSGSVLDHIDMLRADAIRGYDSKGLYTREVTDEKWKKVDKEVSHMRKAILGMIIDQWHKQQ